MKILTTLALTTLLISCDSQEEVTETREPESPRKTQVVSTENRRLLDPSGPPLSQTGFEELPEDSSPEMKREVFSQLIIDTPGEDQDAVINMIIEDLNSDDGANLLKEYLDVSEMLDPALQLQAYARILQEVKLSIIQRAAMEQQLRQHMRLPDDFETDDWKSTVKEHLKTLPGLIQRD